MSPKASKSSFNGAILLLGLCLSLLFPGFLVRNGDAFASEIAFSVRVDARDNIVTLTAVNTGADPAKDVWAEIELAGNKYRSKAVETLLPRASFVERFRVNFPQKTGTYPLINRVYYRNDGMQLSVLNVGYFNFRSERKARARLTIDKTELRNRGVVNVRRSPGLDIELYLPTEIVVLGKEESKRLVSYRVASTRPEFSSNYQIYAVGQVENSDGSVSSIIADGRLSTVRSRKKGSVFPSNFFLMIALVGLLATCFLYRKALIAQDAELDLKEIALIRWAFSVTVISIIYFVFHCAYVVPEHVLSRVTALDFPQSEIGSYLWLIFRTLLQWLYFDGGDYDYFSHYVADPLYLYMLFGNYFVLRFVIKPNTEHDKYWHLMLSTMSLLGLKSSHPQAQVRERSKVAILTLMVKVFYVPLLCSWTINNVHHQVFLTNRFDWSFFKVHEYLVALLIWIDVTVFAFGYLVELPQLKNQIRSVEPTVLGWVVCLMCYPPFNSFAFRPFDIPLTSTWTAASPFWQDVAKVAVLLLWGVYVWATIALGTKASNLTNRGVVDKGPYAYVRHPAYASKVLLWVISALILADKFFFLVVTLITVYALRAWTEERHLSADPEYLEYKGKVKWRFIPYIC